VFVVDLQQMISLIRNLTLKSKDHQTINEHNTESKLFQFYANTGRYNCLEITEIIKNGRDSRVGSPQEFMNIRPLTSLLKQTKKESVTGLVESKSSVRPRNRKGEQSISFLPPSLGFLATEEEDDGSEISESSSSSSFLEFLKEEDEEEEISIDTVRKERPKRFRFDSPQLVRKRDLKMDESVNKSLENLDKFCYKKNTL
jgi:hypothetical protein